MAPTNMNTFQRVYELVSIIKEDLITSTINISAKIAVNRYQKFTLTSGTFIKIEKKGPWCKLTFTGLPSDVAEARVFFRNLKKQVPSQQATENQGEEAEIQEISNEENNDVGALSSDLSDSDEYENKQTIEIGITNQNNGKLSGKIATNNRATHNRRTYNKALRAIITPDQSTTPTTELPKTEPPTIEQPTTEQPTTEPPKTEQPTIKQPTTEQPTTPTTEPPTMEQPTTEQPTTPTTEQPTTPTTEQPTTEQPTTEPLKTKQPTIKQPTTGSPTTEPPKTGQQESPKTEKPTTGQQEFPTTERSPLVNKNGPTHNRARGGSLFAKKWVCC